MGLARAFTEGVEFPALYVGLELPVPGGSIELGKPPAKRRELVRRQALNLTFEITDPVHGYLGSEIDNYTPGAMSARPSVRGRRRNR